MKRILFGFMLAMMTLGGYAQVQAGAKLDKGNAALKKDNGMTKQELTTGKAGNSVELQDKAQQEERAIDQDIKRSVAQNKGKSRKIFGHDIFNSKLLSFEPNMNIATPANYVLGPGDVVVINIYGGSQKENTYQISNEGTVTVPGYGPIRLSGLTVAQANSRLRKTLGKRYRSSNMSTSVSSTRSIRVNVMGEVSVPGTYTLSAYATVFHALYQAGGINNIGTLRNIKVFRNGRQVSVVDVYEYIMNGRLAGNVRLHDNDVIIVGPYESLVDIAGAVKRPMTYEMRKNDNVATILNYAGGFANDAYKGQIRLLRANGDEKTVFNISQNELKSFKVMDGDALKVDDMLDRYSNMVEVKGAVFRPGLYELGKEVTSIRSLVKMAQGLTEDAYPEHAVIHRLKDDRTKRVIAVNIKDILDGRAPDVQLKNEDVIFIPTEADKTKARTLTISGEVQFPGTYEYAENQTIEDFIVQAGGLTDAASTAKVDVSRRILNPSATQAGNEIAKTYTFTLQNGLLINPEPGFFLQPYDQVYVRRSPGFEAQRNVTITGEALFPGEYAMVRKDMRLSDLVKTSGGVSSYAYVKGARIERKMSEDEKLRMKSILKAMAHQNTKHDSIIVDNVVLGDTYYVGIDLEKALAKPGCPEDLILRAGDKLFIPEYNPTVHISGDVMFPNTVSYVPGKKTAYYINQAGGYGNRAKKGKTFVVYQNGHVSVKGKGKIEPGCEVIVPSRPDRKGIDFSALVGMGTSLASLATVIVALTK